MTNPTGDALLEHRIVVAAQLAHEANRAYCASIGDNTQLVWNDAPQWQRDSAINGVRFHIGNPNATPEDSHNNWLRDKHKDGWVWGPDKDPIRKQHPCMRPYDDLPQSQRSKDYIFRGVVHAALSMAL